MKGIALAGVTAVPQVTSLQMCGCALKASRAPQCEQ